MTRLESGQEEAHLSHYQQPHSTGRVCLQLNEKDCGWLEQKELQLQLDIGAESSSLQDRTPVGGKSLPLPRDPVSTTQQDQKRPQEDPWKFFCLVVTQMLLLLVLIFGAVPAEVLQFINQMQEELKQLDIKWKRQTRTFSWSEAEPDRELGAQALLKLACGENVSILATGLGLVCITALLGCCLLILLSYAFIVATILRIPSAEGRHKAFSTCVSHLTVVIEHYGFASVIYLKPKGPQSLEIDTLMGITYTVLTPFLSPIIFSLRNKELKIAMKKTFLSKL
ncbi:hypothetical protein AB1E18_006258 [Capra hircus]